MYKLSFIFIFKPIVCVYGEEREGRGRRRGESIGIVCLLFVGKGHRRKFFNSENFAIYGRYIVALQTLPWKWRPGYS